MFSLRITSYQEAARLIQGRWPTRIISLLPNCSCLGTHHLVIGVDDICRPQQGLSGPEPTHLERVLAFTRTLTDADRLLVHCEAGMSRSAAIAITICLRHGMDPDEAFCHVRKIQPLLSPNPHILARTDAHFGLNGRLVQLNEA